MQPDSESKIDCDVNSEVVMKRGCTEPIPDEFKRSYCDGNFCLDAYKMAKNPDMCQDAPAPEAGCIKPWKKIEKLRREACEALDERKKRYEVDWDFDSSDCD